MNLSSKNKYWKVRMIKFQRVLKSSDYKTKISDFKFKVKSSDRTLYRKNRLKNRNLILRNRQKSSKNWDTNFKGR